MLFVKDYKSPTLVSKEIVAISVLLYLFASSLFNKTTLVTNVI